MKVCNVVRETFYQILASVFSGTAVRPNVLELGVLRGRNALAMYEVLHPKNLVLVDSWSAAASAAFTPFDKPPSWVSGLDSAQEYYGGSLSEQSTFDRLYEECRRNFEGKQNVHFVRHDSMDALDQIKKTTGIDRFELVYIDANHQYEYILRDLIHYQHFVEKEGCIVLNDCCHSDLGVKQNLGVLEAVSNFIKRSDFVPVALTNTDWSDLILVRKGALIHEYIDQVIVNSDMAWVEVPSQLLPAAKVIQGKTRVNISFN
jgi:Methyltransferase domain